MVMRSLRGSLNGSSCGKRSQKVTLAALTLLLMLSIILTVPQTSSKTTIQAVSAEKTAYSNGEVLLNKTFGGLTDDMGYCVIETSDGGYAITGTKWFGDNGNTDVWLIKTDENGEEIWNSTFGGIYSDYGYSVAQTSDGGYIITGSFGSGLVMDYDLWLIKTDSNGDHEWNKTFSGEFTGDNGRCVMQTPDDGYLVVGTTGMGIMGNPDVWLIKTNETGDLEWSQIFDGGQEDYGYCFAPTSDGGYVITGYTYSYDAGINKDLWLIKTNSTGDLEWNKTIGGGANDEGRCVVQANDGGYIIAGSTNSYGTDNQEVWLVKTDQNGNHLWNQTYGVSNWDEGHCVMQASDGGYIITGGINAVPLVTMSIRNAVVSDVLLIKTDENGNEAWNQSYGGTGNDMGNSVIQDSNGDYIVAGFTSTYGIGGSNDVWLLKVASGFPVIDQPADITYEEGSTGHNITWQASDAEPSSYTITSNETLVESGPWTGGNITVSVDGLSVGVYLYTCTVNDTVDQSASDTVMVTVTEPEDGGFPWGGFFFALALIGLAAVIIYSTQYAKKP